MYHQGQLTEDTIPHNNNNKIFKGIFSHNNTRSDFYKKKNMKKINDFHSNFFKILKGTDNDKIINELLLSKNFGKSRIKSKQEEKKVEKKLNLIVPHIMEKKEYLQKDCLFI